MVDSLAFVWTYIYLATDKIDVEKLNYLESSQKWTFVPFSSEEQTLPTRGELLRLRGEIASEVRARLGFRV